MRENLQPSAVVDETAHAVERDVDELLADGVMTARVVVRRILLTSDHLLRMEELLVRASAHLVYSIEDFITKFEDFKNVPTTVGSRSTKMARGTCRPVPVSEKNVLNESSATPTLLSDGICPSG